MFKRLLLSFFLAVSLPESYSGYAQDGGADEGDLNIEQKVNQFLARAEKLVYENPDSALVYAIKARDFSKKNKLRKGHTDALLKISKVYYVQGFYEKSLENVLTGLKQSQQDGYKYGIAFAYNSIGLIYLAQDKLDEAINEFLKSKQISQEINDQKMLCRNYFNLGLSYDEKGNSKEALINLELALEISRAIDDKAIIAMSWNRMGETYFRLNNYDKAIQFYNKVINSSFEVNDWELSFAFSGLAQSQFAQGNYTASVENALKAHRLAKKLNAKWDIERSLKIIFRGYEKLGDYENAFNYLKLDKIYSDSLYSDAKEKEINALHLKQKQLENASLERDNLAKNEKLAERKTIIIIISSLVVFLIISKGLIFWFYRQKNRLNKSLATQSAAITAQNELIKVQNKKLEEVNYAKDQLFSVIGHDLRSPFASILQAMSLIREGDLSTEEMKFVLDGFYEKLAATAGMLDNLVLWAQSQQQGIKARPQMVDITALTEQLLLISELLIQDKQLKLTHEKLGDVKVFCDPDHARIIIHNILGNAIKFTPVNGSIDIFYTESEHFVKMHIKDSGTGMAEEKISQLFNLSGKEISSYGTNQERGIGIGLLLVKRFATENMAEIDVKSRENEGTLFIVKFPKG